MQYAMFKIVSLKHSELIHLKRFVWIQGTLPVPPRNGTAELRLFNTLPCDMNVTLFNGTQGLPENWKTLSSYGMIEFPVSNVTLDPQFELYTYKFRVFHSTKFYMNTQKGL